jgi:hypothetical protein
MDSEESDVEGNGRYPTHYWHDIPFCRAIAQAITCCLPSAVAPFQAWVWSSGIRGGKSGAGASFLRVHRFLLSIRIPPIAPKSSSIIWGWYNRPEVAAVASGLSLTQLKISHFFPYYFVYLQLFVSDITTKHNTTTTLLVILIL